MSKLKKEIKAVKQEFNEFENKYFRNEETNELEFEEENKQLEIDKYADDVNIYKLIDKYENGDILAFNRAKDIAGRELGQDGELDMTALPKDLTDLTNLKKEIERLKAEVESKKNNDIEKTAAEEITKTVISNQEPKEETKGGNE